MMRKQQKGLCFPPCSNVSFSLWVQKVAWEVSAWPRADVHPYGNSFFWALWNSNLGAGGNNCRYRRIDTNLKLISIYIHPSCVNSWHVGSILSFQPKWNNRLKNVMLCWSSCGGIHGAKFSSEVFLRIGFPGSPMPFKQAIWSFPDCNSLIVNKLIISYLYLLSELLYKSANVRK